MTSSHLRIGIVLGHVGFFPPIKGGGIEMINFSLAKELVRMGHQVTCYSRASQNLPDRETDTYGILHIRVPGTDRIGDIRRDMWNEGRYCLRLAARFEKCDVALLNLRWAFALRYLLPAKVVTYTIQRTPKSFLRLFQGMRRLYCPSKAVEVDARLVAPGLNNLKVIYNCVEIDASRPPAFKVKSPGEPMTFLYVGRFVPDKGLESLIKGFAKSLTRFPNGRLVTVGPQTESEGADEKFFETMSRYVTNQGLSDSVSFLTPIYDKAKLFQLMRDSDVVCVPTLTGETFSSAVLEAMSIGKPVLVSDFGPMPEAVEDRVTGVVCKADDADSITEGIDFLSSHPEQLSQLGREGFRKATGFSASAIAKEFVADFYALLGKS